MDQKLFVELCKYVGVFVNKVLTNIKDLCSCTTTQGNAGYNVWRC